ncbi:7090_t:CDS:10, partial [Entrophospora sp. SA101]
MNLYSNYHVAISPNGKEVAIFNTSTFELFVSEANNLLEPRQIKTDSLKNIDNTKKLIWSLAISNPIVNDKDDDFENEILVALSCFHEHEIMLNTQELSSNNNSNNNKNIDLNVSNSFSPISSTNSMSPLKENQDGNTFDEEKGINRIVSSSKSSTWIISTWHEARISTSIDNIGDNLSINKSTNFWWPEYLTLLFNHSDSYQEFDFPSKIQAEIKKLYQNTSCLELLTRNIENDFLLVEDYKDRVQVLEMYNLKTNELEMVFHQKEEYNSFDLNNNYFSYGNPSIAISKYKSLLAYCRGINSITIYLMENSLDIVTKNFLNIERILTIDFINEDESLLIIAIEKDNLDPIIIIWDLFNYMNDSIRIIKDFNKIFSINDNDNHYKLIRSCGTILLFNENTGMINSILENPTIKSIISPSTSSSFTIPTQYNLSSSSLINLSSIVNQFEYNHLIFYQNGKYYNAEKLKDELIVNNKEPWIHNNNYNRISAFLNKEKSLQLIIGESTIQIWYRNKTTNKSEKEFKLSLTITPTIATATTYHHNQNYSSLALRKKINDDIVDIHWPYNNVNLIKDACESLGYLYHLKDDPAGPKKQQEYEDLILQIEKIIIKFIEKYPINWRLINIRYNLMKYLIKKIAIKSIGENNKKTTDVIIINYFLDYYTDNAMDNTGWMFTVSKAIPLLFEYRLDTYVKDLFCKPCFGAKDIHLDESSLNPDDIPKGKSKYIRAFSPNLELPCKNNSSIYANLQKVIPGFYRTNSSSLISLKLVPLPDFTVFPKETKLQIINYRKLPLKLLKLLIWPRGYVIKKESNLSPFLRAVKHDKHGLIYDNPSIEAVIDFKWSSARNHFLRHTALYFIFALLFGLLTGAVKNDSLIYNGNANIGEKIITFSMSSLFYYLGYYILASEIIQLFHEGFRRYISVYNFFDLASVVMPLVTYTCIKLIKSNEQSLTQRLTIAIAFTVLVMWIELFLLLRFFSGPGNYIYIVVNIMKNVWPFISFMLIVVLGFGHAMYILLKSPQEIGVEPDGNQYHIKSTDPNVNSLYNNVLIEQSFNLSNTNDNSFSNFAQSTKAVYFWINGRWDQLEQWDFWPVDVLSILASVLLVIVMQNMLIAFMTGVFDDAKAESRHAVLKYRAELIADYETLENPFGYTEKNPRHIFYIGNANKFAEWLRKCEEYRRLRNDTTATTNYSLSAKER